VNESVLLLQENGPPRCAWWLSRAQARSAGLRAAGLKRLQACEPSWASPPGGQAATMQLVTPGQSEPAENPGHGALQGSLSWAIRSCRPAQAGPIALQAAP